MLWMDSKWTSEEICMYPGRADFGSFPLRASTWEPSRGQNIRTISPGAMIDGKTLYLCARTGLYRIRLNVAGVRPPPPSRNQKIKKKNHLLLDFCPKNRRL